MHKSCYNKKAVNLGSDGDLESICKRWSISAGA